MAIGNPIICRNVRRMGVQGLWLTLALGVAMTSAAIAQETPLVKLQPVPFTDMKVADGFWAPRLETNRTVTTVAKCALDAAQGGANYVDQPVVTDGNLVTARTWQDNTPFLKKFMEMLKAGPR